MTIALITGASRGLGQSTALQCAARGSGVILTYNSHPEGADAVVREIEADGSKAVALKLDVSDTASFPAFTKAVAAALAAICGAQRLLSSRQQCRLRPVQVDRHRFRG